MDSYLIESIAYRVFIDRNSSLECELADHELTLLSAISFNGVRINGKCLIFESIQIIEKFVADYCYKEITLKNNDVDYLIASKSYFLWECGLSKNSTVSGYFLSLFEEHIKVLPLLFLLDKNSYEISSVADQYFHHAKYINIDDVVMFFSYLHHKNDKAFESFDLLLNRFSHDQNNCLKLIVYVQENLDFGCVLLYNIALLALSKVNYQKAVDITLHDVALHNDRITPQAIWIMGVLLKNDANLYKRTDIVSELIKSSASSNSTISEVSINSIVNVLEFSYELRQYISKLLIRSASARLMLSKKLIFSKKLKENKEFPLWLDFICKNASSNIELLSNALHILSGLIEQQKFHSLLHVCLSELMFIDDIEDQHDSLDYLMLCIVKNEALANSLLTLALIDERPQLAKLGVMILLSAKIHGQKYEPKFDTFIIENYENDSFIFLIRKMLGYVTDEEYLFSLTISLLDVSNYQSRTSDFVKQIILNEILVDYPTFVKDRISILRKNCDKRKTFLIKYYDELMKCANSYANGLKKLSMTKEFEPNSIALNAFLKERNKKTAQLDEMQKQNSFISSIATRIPIKAGIGTFHYNDFNDDGYSQPSMLHTFSSSYSLPRRYVIDNVGHEIMTIMYKKAQKGEV
jgi:hypothetical protein